MEKLADLKPDMILEGVVTDAAAFGAFVDKDGLVHISALSNTLVKDPHTVVKTGQTVKVKVLEVDEKRKRIALTMADGYAGTGGWQATSGPAGAAGPSR